MDIMRPPLEEQVAPAPWLVARGSVDVPALIRRVRSEQPDASVDNIVRQLGERGVQVSGIIVSMWVLKFREQDMLAKAAKDKTSSVAMGGVETYCTCSDQPCSCGKPRPPAWWHQYCCGVRVTPAQANARDEFFEHAAT